MTPHFICNVFVPEFLLLNYPSGTYYVFFSFYITGMEGYFWGEKNHKKCGLMLLQNYLDHIS